MQRNILAVGVLVILLITAGCMGTGGNDEGTPTTDSTPTATPVQTAGDANSDDSGSDGTTATATATSTDSAPGGTASDSTNWAATDSEAALRAASSFTSSWSWHLSNPETGGVDSVSVSSAVDLTNERASHAMTVTGEDGVVMETFRADGKVYTRMGSPDESEAPFYMVSEQDFDPDDVVDYRGFIYSSDNFDDWAFEGVEQYDGVSVQRYSYQGSDPWLGTEQVDNEFTARSWRFTILVDRDGIVRYQTYRIDGVDAENNNMWIEWEYTVTDVGTTTVSNPAWLAEAKA